MHAQIVINSCSTAHHAVFIPSRWMVGERCNVEAVTVTGRERHGVTWFFA
jgi:hypothetical protein